MLFKESIGLKLRERRLQPVNCRVRTRVGPNRHLQPKVEPLPLTLVIQEGYCPMQGPRDANGQRFHLSSYDDGAQNVFHTY